MLHGRTIIMLLAVMTIADSALAMYDPKAGRFLQHDPRGIDPAEGSRSQLEMQTQFGDGLNLYEYANSNPSAFVDALGLWGWHVHFGETRRWARMTGMWGWAAFATGHANIMIDTVYYPGTIDHDVLSWHFDMPYDDILSWGVSDSRFVHAETEYQTAVSICNAGGDDAHTIALQALTHLGGGLHPVQDWVAHGTWQPIMTLKHLNPIHPDGSDDYSRDFLHEADGILRDWDHYPQHWLGPPSPLFGGTANLRQDATRTRTNEYLKRFKAEVRNTVCFCEIYQW